MKTNIKNLFGKLLVGVVVLSTALVPNKASADVLTTNFPAANGVYAIATNGLRVSNIQLLSGANASAIVYLYDSPYGTTNYTNASFVSRTQYSTNLVLTNISPLTGYTNIFTNVGLFTYSVTNAAATNNALPARIFAVQPSTLGNFPVDYVFNRGLTVRATTNASLIITYQSISGN